MFGKNPVARPFGWEDETYRVQEVFYTVQGEGPLAGQPALFIRMSHCNLRCYFCDTDFTTSTWEPKLDELLADIAPKVRRAKCIVITGGEPMLQQLGPLCYELIKAHGLPIQIETAGTVWPTSFNDLVVEQLLLNNVVSFVCSPKTGKVNEMVEAYCRHWKYIISCDAEIDEIDGLPNSSTQKPGQRVPLYRPPVDGDHVVWLQPQDEYVHTLSYDTSVAGSSISTSVHDDIKSRASRDLACDLAMRHGYRVSIQMHKVLGLP